MTVNDLAVLLALDETTCPDEYAVGFAEVQKSTELTRSDVRASCRRLARKGLAEYRRGLLRDDGGVAGSGYGITDAGRELARQASPR